MALQGDAIADLVAMTLKQLGRGKFNEIITPYQEYVISKDLLKSKNQVQQGGHAVQRNIMVTESGNARWTGMFATENTTVKDVMKTISVPHRIYVTSWAFDEIEMAQNSGDAVQILNLMVPRRFDAMKGLCDLLERGLVDLPPSSTDTDVPYGLNYWIVWTDNSGTNANGGFDGGHPSGFSDVAGLSATTYANWKNWVAKYTNVTEDDLLDKWRRAAIQTNFMPPTEIPEYGKGQDFGFYTTLTTMMELVKTTRAQNENLGTELENYKGTPIFRGIPVKYVPIFEDTGYIAASSDPIFGINWRTMHFCSLTGWDMKESGPFRDANQPLVRRNYIHGTCNLMCNNRRKNFILAKAQPAV